MSFSAAWAKAFINSIESEGVEIEDGIDTLRTLASQIKSLPGVIFGRNAAEKLEKLIRDGMAKIAAPPSFELSSRFLILMVRKNKFRHINAVIKEIEKLVNKKRSIIEVSVEYASSLEEQSRIRITELIKKRTGAVDVILNSKQNPELIGGYKIRIGDEVIDASVRYQLEKLKTDLQGGQTHLAAGDGGY